MKLPKDNGIVNTRYRFGVKTGPAAFAVPIKLKINTTWWGAPGQNKVDEGTSHKIEITCEASASW